MPNLLEYPKTPTGANAHLAPTNSAQLNSDLVAARADMNQARRVLRGAMLTTARAGLVGYTTPEQLAQYRQDVVATVAAYNAAVEIWHAAWAPWREAERTRRQEVRTQLQATKEQTRRAQLRAATCPDCGTIHPGGC